jgi:hypothetical protein
VICSCPCPWVPSRFVVPWFRFVFVVCSSWFRFVAAVRTCAGGGSSPETVGGPGGDLRSSPGLFFVVLLGPPCAREGDR